MKCHCYETDSEFIFCVEDVGNAQLEEVIKHMAWNKLEGKFVRPYPLSAFSNQNEKECISDNFSRLGQVMFESSVSGFDWKKSLDLIAQHFLENEIEWFIVGSICDAIRGVNVQPFDIDIIVHTKDFLKVKDICNSAFPEAIIAPFDTQGTLYLQYFGRMFLAGAMIEIVADERWNPEYRQCEKSIWRDNGYTQPEYVKTVWHGHEIYVESLQHRHQAETKRNRMDRIKAIEEYMDLHQINFFCKPCQLKEWSHVCSKSTLRWC